MLNTSLPHVSTSSYLPPSCLYPALSAAAPNGEMYSSGQYHDVTRSSLATTTARRSSLGCSSRRWFQCHRHNCSYFRLNFIRGKNNIRLLMLFFFSSLISSKKSEPSKKHVPTKRLLSPTTIVRSDIRPAKLRKGKFLCFIITKFWDSGLVLFTENATL